MSDRDISDTAKLLMDGFVFCVKAAIVITILIIAGAIIFR